MSCQTLAQFLLDISYLNAYLFTQCILKVLSNSSYHRLINYQLMQQGIRQVYSYKFIFFQLVRGDLSIEIATKTDSTVYCCNCQC